MLTSLFQGEFACQSKVVREKMKKLSVYWWTFLVSGLVWIIGVIAPVVIVLTPYPQCDLPEEYFSVSMFLLSWFGSGVFLITLVVWIIHRRKMRILFLLLILLECFLFMFFIAPGSFHPRNHVRAFVNWRKNPTPETEQIWQQENRKFQIQRKIAHNTLITLIFVNGCAIIWIGKRIRKT